MFCRGPQVSSGELLSNCRLAIKLRRTKEDRGGLGAGRVTVEVAVLGFRSLIVFMVSVGVK